MLRKCNVEQVRFDDPKQAKEFKDYLDKYRYHYTTCLVWTAKKHLIEVTFNIEGLYGRKRVDMLAEFMDEEGGLI